MLSVTQQSRAVRRLDSCGPRGASPSRLSAPSIDVELGLLGGGTRRVPWGEPWQFLTAAYWIGLTERWIAEHPLGESHGLGKSLVQEVVACLLGGHGITYELNVAAFRALDDSGLVTLARRASEEHLREVLIAPLHVQGRTVRYRFPNQKAYRIATALERLRAEEPPEDSLRARDWLMSFSGIGPKTASWIVRNRYPNSNVAIIDIHVQRAAVRAHVFDPEWLPAKNYWLMESAFLEWARIGGVPASDLDAIIWQEQAAAARRRPAKPNLCHDNSLCSGPNQERCDER